MRPALSLLALLSGCKSAHHAPAPDALGPLIGAWYSEQLNARLVIAESGGGTPEVSFYTYQPEASWPTKGAILVGEALRFSASIPAEPGQEVFFQVELLDQDTVQIRAFAIDHQERNEDIFTAKRSAYPGGASSPDEAAAVQQQAADREVPANVDGIKTAELAYDAAFDGFVAVAPWPRDPSQLTPQPMRWPAGGGFDTIGWSPDGPVRGSYEVDVSSDSTDFTVHGWIDADGDGRPAHWTATKSINAVRVTPEGVR